MPAPREQGQSSPDFMDVPAARRRNMAAVRNRNTKPEMTARRALHAMGFRFRLHGRDLPGTPDIILPRWKAVILVNGCVWHVHEGCARAKMPVTRKEWWAAKLQGNVARDRRKRAELEAAGWRVLTVWECDLRRNPAAVAESMRIFILGDGATAGLDGSRPDAA